MHQIDRLVCSGSGVLFPAHLGAFAALKKFNLLNLETVTKAGTSGGALALALISYGYSPRDALRVTQSSPPSKMLSLNPKIWQPYNSMGLFSSEKFAEKLESILPGQLGNIQSDLYLTVSDVTYVEATPVYLHPKTHPGWSLAGAVAASSAVPFLFTPYRYGDHIYVDGGVIDNVPTLMQETELTIYVHHRTTRQKVDSRTAFIASLMNGLLVEEVNPASTNVIHLYFTYNGFDFLHFDAAQAEAIFNEAYEQTLLHCHKF